MGLITTVGLMTIALSTYLIIHSARLYEWLAPWPGVSERRIPYREAAADTGAPLAADAVVFGLGRYGGGIVRHLLLRNRRVIGVDFDPEALSRWREEGIPVIYGDAGDPELFGHLPLKDVNWVVSTAPDIETSRMLLHHLRQHEFGGRIALTCRTADEGDRLRLEGADVLLRPYADAAEQAADAITTAMDRLGALAAATPGLREVRMGTTSKWAGHRIADVPLRDEFGATVLAVSRGGRSVFNPGPSFHLFPGDRLILSGEPSALDRAIDYLARIDHPARQEGPEDFAVQEVDVGSLAGWADARGAAASGPVRRHRGGRREGSRTGVGARPAPAALRTRSAGARRHAGEPKAGARIRSASVRANSSGLRSGAWPTNTGAAWTGDGRQSRLEPVLRLASARSGQATPA